MSIAFTVASVSLIICIRSETSNGSRLWMVPLSSTGAVASVPALNLDELVADEAVVLDRGDRVDPDQRMEILPHPHPDAEPSRGTGRNANLFDLPGIHSRHPDFRPHVERRDLRELRMDLERVPEHHPPVADEEQTDRKQQKPPNHERANRGSTKVRH